jgi:hypothetical protein
VHYGVGCELNRQPIFMRLYMLNSNCDTNINVIEPEASPLKPVLEESELQDIPIKNIKLSDFCQRAAVDEDLDVLAESIERDGLLQFPTVTDNRDDSYTLIFGSRR